MQQIRKRLDCAEAQGFFCVILGGGNWLNKKYFLAHLVSSKHGEERRDERSA